MTVPREGSLYLINNNGHFGDSLSFIVLSHVEHSRVGGVHRDVGHQSGANRWRQGHQQGHLELQRLYVTELVQNRQGYDAAADVSIYYIYIFYLCRRG